MYPTLYHAVKDIFGLDIPFLKLIMMFGFFVALAFVAALWAMTSELKRREAIGQVKSFMKPVVRPSLISEYFTSSVIGFIVGFKLVYLVFNLSLVSDDPQGFLLSLRGSWLWGVIMLIAFVAYKYYTLKKLPPLPKDAKVEFHPYEMMGNLTVIAALAGFVGAKVFHHLEYWDEFMADPIGALADPFSGLTFFGGLICGGAAVLWYANKHGVKWKTMLDVGGPAMMLAYGVGRLGCHTSGDGDWGIENIAPKPDWLSWLPDWAWAYDYPNNVLNVVLENPVWPTPLYEVVMAFILFGVLWAIRKRDFAPGVLFSIYLIFSGIERFLIEKIRVNSKYHILGMEVTQAELISTLFVVLGVLGIIYFTKQRKNQKELVQ